MTLRAYKYRAYPTKGQTEFLSQNFGCVRLLWNKLVANFNSWSSTGPNQIMSEKSLKDNPDFDFLNDVISYALQQKWRDFDETKKQYFNKKRKVKLGRMKFKSKSSKRDSFRIPGQALGFSACVDFDLGTIKLPKMSPMKIIIDRKFTGTLKSVTVSRNPSNQYFVSVLVEEEIELKQNTGRSIGIDLGLTHLAILSNGIKFENPRWFRENQAKLKRAQRHLSRKTNGSKRRTRQRLKVARIHQKISNQRNWLHHNLSSWLVSNFDVICTEDLAVKNMVRNHKLSKSISDASWSSLISMISYKSGWYGRTFHKIGRWYASSKTCGCCGAKAEAMNLSIREWTCASCGTSHDRDINAAVNILNTGLKDLYSLTSAELADYRRREAVRPEVEIPMASSMKRLVRSL
jgi:putative transposase